MSTPFIVLNGTETISLAQAFRYLQAQGKLDAFVGDVLREYIIERELRSRIDLLLPRELVQQAITEFRLQTGLSDAQQFQQWLANQGLTEEVFRLRVETDLRVGRLRETVTQPRLQQHFIERKLFLDQVVLSRIAVEQKELAEELLQQLKEGASFEELAQEYSVSDDAVFNGMMGLISRGQLPDNLRAALDTAQPGDVLGPIELPPVWTIIRLEQAIAATLDNPQLVQSLQNELMEQWVLEQLEGLTIEVKVGDD